MISKVMKGYVEGSVGIGAMFAEGKHLVDLYGAENVYDYSIGNPNLEPPKAVNDAIIEVLNTEDQNLVHGYMNNSGYEDVRRIIAQDINRKFGTNFDMPNILMTVGAAGGLNVILKTLINPGDEVINFAPYFCEYFYYIANYNATEVIVSSNPENFQPNLVEFETKITPATKAVIVNSPNNPTGVIYSEATILELTRILKEKQKEYGTSIYIICDEPYRELAYDGIEVPYMTKYYDNTIVSYSFSKSLSLPGERIGYLVIPSETDDFTDIIMAANIANRTLGFVNAPSLLQRAVIKCLDQEVDVEIYNKNREALYNGLTEAGYECIKPEGAFYLFIKSPIEDDLEFFELAKKYNILVMPGSFFAGPGYFRLAYCVSYKTIVDSLPKFKELMQEIKSRA